MAVLRIVTNIACDAPAKVAAFYADLLGLRVVLDMGWIVTLAGDRPGSPQLSLAQEGGASTPVPDISVEVDDLDAVLERARSAGHPITYGPAIEPWGVRRFFLRDPAGRLVNILSHE